jgi:hypothetical protein
LVKGGMMITVTYGFGGYDPTKPNNNIVDIEETNEPDTITEA